MAAIPRDELPLRRFGDADCATRTLINTAVGAGAGVVGALIALTMRGSSGAAAGSAFRNLSMTLLPVTTGASALYTVVSCTFESNRGTKDWRNSFAGGAAAGAFVAGLTQRTIWGATLGAVGFGFATAGVQIARSLDATSEETARADVDARKFVSSTQDFARNVKAAESFSREKLQ